MFVQAGRAYNPAASPSPCLLHRIWQTINCRWYFGASAENIFKGHCCPNRESNLSAETGPLHHSTHYTYRTFVQSTMGPWWLVHGPPWVCGEGWESVCAGSIDRLSGHQPFWPLGLGTAFLHLLILNHTLLATFPSHLNIQTGWLGINHSGLLALLTYNVHLSQICSVFSIIFLFP